MIGVISPLLPSLRKEEWTQNEGANPIGEPALIVDAERIEEKAHTGGKSEGAVQNAEPIVRDSVSVNGVYKKGRASLALPVKIVSCFGVLEYWSIGKS